MVLRTIAVGAGLLGAAERQARRADRGGGAADEVLGELDVLDELDVRVEVEGGRHER